MKQSILILTILLFLSCTKDPKDPIPDVQVKPTTPYVFDIPSYFGPYSDPKDNPTTNEGVELGRHLFYENKLSGNNSMSCATCHKQELGFADGLAVSPGIDGIPGNRSTMALSNMQFQNSYFWDGRSLTLEHQALGPIENPLELKETLGNVVNKLKNDPKYPNLFEAAFGKKEITPDKIAKAISQFERTLISSNSKYDKFLRREIQFTESELRGRNLFVIHPQAGTSTRGANCGDCHGGDLFKDTLFLNNGLDEILIDKGRSLVTGSAFDDGKFKIPSLRNIAVTAPYMHDGRFANLEQVIEQYDKHVKMNSPNISPLMFASNIEIPGSNPPGVLLTAAEKADLLAFLHTLTDSTFLTNPKFAKP